MVGKVRTRWAFSDGVRHLRLPAPTTSHSGHKKPPALDGPIGGLTLASAGVAPGTRAVRRLVRASPGGAQPRAPRPPGVARAGTRSCWRPPDQPRDGTEERAGLGRRRAFAGPGRTTRPYVRLRGRAGSRDVEPHRLRRCRPRPDGRGLAPSPTGSGVLHLPDVGASTFLVARLVGRWLFRPVKGTRLAGARGDLRLFFFGGR